MRPVPRDIAQIRVRPRRRALIAVTVTLGALAGCSTGSATQAEVPAITPGPDATSPACTELLERLPATVLSKARITAREPAGTARWGTDDGDDAILLSCGAPPTGPTTDQCIEVNDVSWVFREAGGGYSFLTYGRDPAVQVLVPGSVERTQATAALVDLNDAVDPLEKTERRCYDLADTAPSAAPS